MQTIFLSGLLVEPIAERLRAWTLDGKIHEEDLEFALTPDARSLLDHSTGFVDWMALEDVEGLIGLVSDHIGGETGLVEWAGDLVECWQDEAPIEDLIRGARALTDTPGFLVSQASELLVRDADWVYDGGRAAFSVRLRGLKETSPIVKALLGAVLAALARVPQGRDFDVRFDGVEGDELIVYGEAMAVDDGEGESRLHQAALIA